MVKSESIKILGDNAAKSINRLKEEVEALHVSTDFSNKLLIIEAIETTIEKLEDDEVEPKQVRDFIEVGESNYDGDNMTHENENKYNMVGNNNSGDEDQNEILISTESLNTSIISILEEDSSHEEVFHSEEDKETNESLGINDLLDLADAMIDKTNTFQERMQKLNEDEGSGMFKLSDDDDDERELEGSSSTDPATENEEILNKIWQLSSDTNARELKTSTTRPTEETAKPSMYSITKSIIKFETTGPSRLSTTKKKTSTAESTNQISLQTFSSEPREKQFHEKNMNTSEIVSDIPSSSQVRTEAALRIETKTEIHIHDVSTEFSVESDTKEIETMQATTESLANSKVLKEEDEQDKYESEYNLESTTNKP